MKKKMVLGLAALMAVAGLSACATRDSEKAMLIAFNDANYYFSKGKFDQSQISYQSILDEHPDSPYRIHALLGVADSYYMLKDFSLSIPMYERFVELYPLDPMTNHALFYQGMSYFQDLLEVKRDQTNAVEALDTFGLFLKRYPEHPAGEFAREKIELMNDRLAEKELYLAKFYFGIGAFGSCIGRVDDLLEKYPDTRFKPKALLLKASSYREEEAFKKAKATYAQITSEFPETPHAAEATQELTKLKAF